jgi:hypothetical protein
MKKPSLPMDDDNVSYQMDNLHTQSYIMTVVDCQMATVEVCLFRSKVEIALLANFFNTTVGNISIHLPRFLL